MAENPKGEIKFEVGKKQFTWCFSVGAICALEDHLDRGLIDITTELQSWMPPSVIKDGKPVPAPESPEDSRARNARIRLGFARAVFWAGLQDHHPDTSLKAAGDLIGEMGGLIPALGIIVRGMGSAMPNAAAEDAPAVPRMANRRTRRAVG